MSSPRKRGSRIKSKLVDSRFRGNDKNHKEVEKMKFDNRVLTGLLFGVVLGLHYHSELVTYMPLLVIAALVMLLKFLHH